MLEIADFGLMSVFSAVEAFAADFAAEFAVEFAVVELGSAVFWAAVWKIMAANVVLSGDNAVVIALACKNLPARHKKRAILFGSIGAIALRILFCAVIGLLLGVPYLKLMGGALLLWIGVRMLTGQQRDEHVAAHATLGAAVWTIVVADAVMSLDNAIAIAAAARGSMALIAIGLVASIPVIVFGATVISRLLDRLPWLGLVGAALIGWIAGDVVAGERVVAEWLDGRLPHAEYASAAIGAGLVVLIGLSVSWTRERRHRS
jgi:YjbE family integral membrane protein